MIRAIVIFFTMLLLASCLSKPKELNYRDGTERLALLGFPFWVDDREGTRTELIYGGRNGSEIVIIFSEKVGDDTSPANKRYKFNLSESNIVTVDKYRLKIIMAYEADMMFRFIVN